MPIYYNEKELKTILQIKDGEKKVFIPNEIFEDLIEAVNCEDKGKSSKHIAFAFTYHYLVMYLWRYAILAGDFEFTEDELKKICTVSPHSKGKGSINYITKKGGVLCVLGYIVKVSDFPAWQFYIKESNEINFGFWSDYKNEIPQNKNTRSRKVNEPLKLTSTRIFKNSEGEYESEGILYDISNTTEISIDVFVYCMCRRDLGCEGFYLYCFLKHMNFKFAKGWNCPLDKMPTEVGMKRDIVKDRLKSLEEYNMISNSHEPFVPSLRAYTHETIPANTYKTKEYHEFVTTGNPKLHVKKRRVISPERYEKEIGFHKSKEIDIDLPGDW